MQLVMVHGSGQNELTYHYQTAAFGDADALNLPGHPDGEPRDSIGGYVDWVREYAHAKGYPPFVLFGHSMGGAIALDYALRFPGGPGRVGADRHGGAAAGASRLPEPVPG